MKTQLQDQFWKFSTSERVDSTKFLSFKKFTRKKNKMMMKKKKKRNSAWKLSLLYIAYWVVLVKLKRAVFYQNNTLKIFKETADLHKNPE
jgi:hypothetical protein